MQLSKLKQYLPFILVLFIALFLRLYQLGDVPHGLHNDEIANTYGTRFIILNGKDLYGNKWPLLYLDKFGDYPPILPMYLSGLGTFIFGNNEFGSRSLIAIFGAMTIIPMYLLALQIFKNKNAALFAAFITAIAPVHIMLSRLNAEGVAGLFIFLFALTFLFKSLEIKSNRSLIISVLLFLLTYLFYPSYRILVPITLLASLFLLKPFRVNKNYSVLLIGSTIISFALTIYISSTFWGEGRFAQTSILSPLSGVSIQLQKLIFDEKGIFIARVFHNKIVGYGMEFIQQYFTYFDPNFLFGHSGEPIIYSAPYSTLLYMSLIPLLFISVVGYFQRKNNKINYSLFFMILFLIVLAPVPAALTVVEVPSIQRALLFPVIFILLFVYGYNALRDIKFKGFPVIYLVFLPLLFESIFFFHNYFDHVSLHTSLARNDGNTEVTKYIIENENKYDAIYVTSKEAWLPTFYLFYTNNYDPKYIGKFKENFRLDTVNKVHFIEENCPSNRILNDSISKLKLTVPQKTLIVNNIDCDLDTSLKATMFKVLTSIKRRDETDAFDIVEVNPQFTNEDLVLKK